MTFKEKYLGDKEFYTYVLKLALPMMLQGLVISLSGLIDNLMVAGLGDNFLSGVAAANRFYIIFNFAVNGVALAGGIFIGQYLGARRPDKMKESFRATMILSYLIMIPFFIAIYFYPSNVLSFFTKDLSVIESGINYYQAVVWAMIPLTMSMVISISIRSIGDTKSPVIASIIGIVVNLFFNYLLIFGNFGFPALGVYGSGLATLISRIVEASILLYIMKIKDFDFASKFKDLFKIEKRLFKLVTKNSINIGANEILWGSSMAFLMKFYSTRGPAAMTAYSIAGSISDIFFILFGGMAAATTVLVGHNLGANKFKKAKINGYRLLALSIGLAIVFGTIMIFISNFIPLIYPDVSNEAQKIAVSLIKIIGIFFWTYMYNLQILFMLRAGGDSLSAFIMDSGFMWLVNIPVVGFFTYYTKLPIVYLYLIGQTTDLVKLTVSTYVFKKELWIKNVTEFT